jgi:hypothetical protein
MISLKTVALGRHRFEANQRTGISRYRRITGLQRTGRKAFFFEKKNQKTSARLPPATPRQPRKSFCFFFQKEACLTYSVPSVAANGEAAGLRTV